MSTSKVDQPPLASTSAMSSVVEGGDNAPGAPSSPLGGVASEQRATDRVAPASARVDIGHVEGR
jgi:hypothetical protein